MIKISLQHIQRKHNYEQQVSRLWRNEQITNTKKSYIQKATSCSNELDMRKLPVPFYQDNCSEELEAHM